MQNTSKIPNVPNVLLKNFFMAGVNQKTLANKILENKAFSIQPEVLFSMYTPKDKVANYLQFVFPERITVEYRQEDPKFFTFMTTDQDGFNSFIHCLIFYEEINEAEINSNDFDIVLEKVRKQHLSRQKSPGKKSGPLRTSIEDRNGGLMLQHRKKLQEILIKRNHKQCLTITDISRIMNTGHKESETSVSVIQETEEPDSPRGNVDKMIQMLSDQQAKKRMELKKKEMNKKEKMTKFLQNINTHQRTKENAGQSFHHKIQSLQFEPVPKHSQGQSDALQPNLAKQRTYQPNKNSEEGNQIDNNHKSKRGHVHQSSDPLQPFMQKRHAIKIVKKDGQVVYLDTNNFSGLDESRIGDDDQITFTKASKYMKFISKIQNQQQLQTQDDYYGDQRRKESIREQHTTYNDTQEEPVTSRLVKQQMTMEGEEYYDEEYVYEEGIGGQPFMMSREAINEMQSQYEIDNDQDFNNLYQKKRYVPVALCMETETEYHDIFRKIMLVMFEEIRVPEVLVKNRVFDNRMMAFAELISHLAFLRTVPCPPFNSILNLHFLSHKFVISEPLLDQIPNKNSQAIKVLFDVLDVRSILYCWKALLFDKTLVLVSSQYSLQFYLAESLKQLLFPLTFQNTYIQPGNESLAGHVDGPIICLYGSNSSMNGFDYFDGMTPEMAVVDIDGCYTNNIQMETLPDETMYIRILNMLKNSRINQYDKAYPEIQENDDNEDFVNQVRETFFGILKPFLAKVENYIDKKVESQGAYFDKYFRQEDYLEEFSNYGECHYQFAKALCQSSQFIHFCDDYFTEELNNFQLLRHILISRGEMIDPEAHSNGDKQTHSPSKKPQWPEHEPVTFNIRMPQDNQRFMLFEKIEFLNEESIRKMENGAGNNQDTQMIKEKVMYEKIIANIKKLYPVKLKGTHRQFQKHDSAMRKKAQQMYNGLGIDDSMLIPDLIKLPSQRLDKYQKSPILPEEENNLRHKHNRSSVRENHQRFLTPGLFPFQTPKKVDSHYQKNGNTFEINAEDSIAISNSIPTGNSFLEIEQLRIQNNKQRISRLVYGQKGLINFLQHLFGLLTDYQMGKVNYYFSLKKQMISLIQQEQQQNDKTNLQGMDQPIMEEIAEEALSSPSVKRLSPTNAQKKISQLSLLMIDLATPNSQYTKGFQYDDTTRKRAQTNKNGQPRFQENTTMSVINLTQSQYQKAFKSEKEWIAIDEWDTKARQLQKTHQVLWFKIKTYESFECPEDGYSLIWNELMKFPSNQMKFFPKTKFQSIWEYLTVSQQQELFVSLGKNQDKPQVQMICKDYMRQQNKRKGSASSSYNNGSLFQTQQGTNKNGKPRRNDENVFCGVSISKNYVQKRTEQKEKELARKKLELESSKVSQNSIIRLKTEEKKSLVGTPPNNVTNLIKGKLEKTMQKRQLDKQSRNVSDASTIQSKSLSRPSELQSFKTQSDPIQPQSYDKNFATFDHLSVHPIANSHKGDFSFHKSSNPSMFKQSQSISMLNQFDLSNSTFKKPTEQLPKKSVYAMKDPEKFGINLMNKIIDFWQKNAKFMDRKGKFEESELERIQNEMTTFDKHFEYMKNTQPKFPQSTDDQEFMKQAFFLNLFNFLVLYELSVLSISQPEGIEQLTNYNMWQALLSKTQVKLGRETLSAFQIMQSILRATYPPPYVTLFNLQSAIHDPQFEPLIVHTPHPLSSFGLFLPLKGRPDLRIFKSARLDHQLRSIASKFLSRKLLISKDRQLMLMPKFMQQYQKDFIKDRIETLADSINNFKIGSNKIGMQLTTDKQLSLLRFIEDNIFQSNGQSKISKLLQKLDSKELKPCDIIIDTRGFSWAFRPVKLSKYLSDERVGQKKVSHQQQ